MPSEADSCRRYVVPALQQAGWESEPHAIAEQRTITDGRIIPVGQGFVRKPSKRADYLLYYEKGFPLAVVEAKAEWRSAGDGLQLPPEELAASILKKEQRIAEIVTGIQKLLAK